MQFCLGEHIKLNEKKKMILFPLQIRIRLLKIILKHGIKVCILNLSIILIINNIPQNYTKEYFNLRVENNCFMMLMNFLIIRN